MDTADDSLLRLGHLISDQIAPPAIAPGEWPAIVSLAQRHRLAPILYWRLKPDGAEILSAPLWQRLRNESLRVAKAYLLLDLARQQLEQALAEIGLPCVWLKGSALAPTVYAHPSLRPMVDLDLLVPYEQREVALASVQALGYERRPPGLLSENSHHYHLVGGKGNLVHIELHYWLLGRTHTGLLPPAQLRWFWTQAQEIDVAPGQFLLTLTPEAHLLYLCAHALLQHGDTQTDLLHILDLHYLIGKSILDWELVAQKAVELRWAYAVEQALRKSITHFATPVPEHVFSTLSQARTPDDFVERVRLLQGTGTNFERVWHFLRALSLPAALHYFRRILIPPPSYMRRRYQVPAGRPVWPHYPLRWRNQARQTLVALRHRLRLLIRRYRN